MTGIELLRDKMLARGATRQSANSKAVEMVVEILAEEAGLIDQIATDIIRKSKEIKAREGMIISAAESEARSIISNAKNDYRVKRLSDKEAEIDRKLKAYEEYRDIRDRIVSGLPMEYAARLVMAAEFRHRTRIDTVYDNTAYIRGLAYILSGMERIEIIEKDKSEGDKKQ